jgi:hypothetical protein
VQTVETRYVFHFLDPAGRKYLRHVYWEALHAVSHADGSLLTASRAVPLNDTLFAFYASVRHAFLQREDETPLLGAPAAEGSREEAPEEPPELVPQRYPEMLALALHEQDDLPSAPIRRLAAQHSGIRPRPPSAAIEAYMAHPPMGPSARRDGPLPPVPMIPPALRRFLRGRYARLGDVVSRYEKEEELDPRFHRERMESLVGRAEARALGTNEQWQVVVLGTVEEGDLPINERDPQQSGASYQVDPDADLGGVRLREITSKIMRAAIRIRIPWSLHGNIRSVLFVDDLK